MAEEQKGRWEDLARGQQLGPVEYRVSLEAVRHYCATLGISSARYEQDSSFGGPIVPPMLVATDYGALLSQVLPPFTGMHARHRLQLRRPIPVGEPLTLKGQIVERFIKRDRRYLVVDYWIEDAAGERLLANRITTTIASYIDVQGGHAER